MLAPAGLVAASAEGGAESGGRILEVSDRLGQRAGIT